MQIRAGLDSLTRAPFNLSCVFTVASSGFKSYGRGQTCRVLGLLLLMLLATRGGSAWLEPLCIFVWLLNSFMGKQRSGILSARQSAVSHLVVDLWVELKLTAKRKCCWDKFWERFVVGPKTSALRLLLYIDFFLYVVSTENLVETLAIKLKVSTFIVANLKV